MAAPLICLSKTMQAAGDHVVCGLSMVQCSRHSADTPERESGSLLSPSSWRIDWLECERFSWGREGGLGVCAFRVGGGCPQG